MFGGNDMKRCTFEIVLGAILALFLIIFCIWQAPATARGKLTTAEIDRYLAAADRQLVFDGKEQVLARIRAWAQADDGRPVYMLNLMRSYPEIHRLPGAPDFKGTPEEANRYYEQKAVPLLLKTGSYPLMMGKPQGKSVLGPTTGIDNVDRVLVVRYTSRRAFLALLADPAYGPIEPYKIMAFDTTLLPVSGDLVIPDTRMMAGFSLFALFLAVGWFRSVRQQRSGSR